MLLKKNFCNVLFGSMHCSTFVQNLECITILYNFIGLQIVMFSDCDGFCIEKTIEIASPYTTYIFQ